MSEIQFLRTPSGEELVVLSRSDYENLVAAADEAAEDAADAAMFDERSAALSMEKDGLLPADVSMSMLRGDSLLRALRRWRKMSQTTLARTAGIGQGYLSDMEAHRRGGGPETLEKLATALKVPAAWLHAGPRKID